MNTIPKTLDGISQNEIIEILNMEDSEEQREFKQLLLKHNASRLIRSIVGREILVRADDEIVKSVKDAISLLDTPREKDIILYHFGLDDESFPCEHTLEETGNKYGMTKERVRQIEARALRKMHSPTYAKHYEKYILTDEQIKKEESLNHDAPSSTPTESKLDK